VALVKPDTAVGELIIFDATGCDATLLRDLAAMQLLFNNLIDAYRATLIQTEFSQFPDTGGLTIIAILSASSATLHTWPELNYLAVDIFRCNVLTPTFAGERLIEAALPGCKVRMTTMKRPI